MMSPVETWLVIAAIGLIPLAVVHLICLVERRSLRLDDVQLDRLKRDVAARREDDT